MPAIWISSGIGNLLLDLFGRASRPLRDDLDVVVGDVRIGLDGKVVKRDDAPTEEQDGEAKDQPAVVQRKIDETANHYWSAVFCSASAFETTCWPTSMPESISCILPGKVVAASHWHAAELAVARGNVDPVAIVQVEHRSGGHLRVGLKGLAMDRRRGKHSYTHQRIGVFHLDAHLGGANLGIEDSANVADDSGQNTVRDRLSRRISAFWPRCTVDRSFS